MGIKELEELAGTGKYVFHGSPVKLGKLEPRQAMRVDRELRKEIPDGKPCVAATPYYEIAIFRSLISAQVSRASGLMNHRSEFGIRMGKPYFKASKSAYDNAKTGIKGYVHVFDKDLFEDHSNMEVRAYAPVVPIQVIEVTGEDLPEEIEII